MNDIFKEILDDKNEERKLYYFKKLIPITIIFVLIVALFMVLNNWWKHKKMHEQQQLGDILIKTMWLQNNNIDLVMKSLENLINSNNARISELAAIKQADIFLKSQEGTSLATKLVANREPQNLRETITSDGINKSLKNMVESSHKFKNELEQYQNSNPKTLPKEE